MHPWTTERRNAAVGGQTLDNHETETVVRSRQAHLMPAIHHPSCLLHVQCGTTCVHEESGSPGANKQLCGCPSGKRTSAAGATGVVAAQERERCVPGPSHKDPSVRMCTYVTPGRSWKLGGSYHVAPQAGGGRVARGGNAPAPGIVLAITKSANTRSRRLRRATLDQTLEGHLQTTDNVEDG